MDADLRTSTSSERHDDMSQSIETLPGLIPVMVSVNQLMLPPPGGASQVASLNYPPVLSALTPAGLTGNACYCFR